MSPPLQAGDNMCLPTREEGPCLARSDHNLSSSVSYSYTKAFNLFPRQSRGEANKLRYEIGTYMYSQDYTSSTSTDLYHPLGQRRHTYFQSWCCCWLFWNVYHADSRPSTAFPSGKKDLLTEGQTIECEPMVRVYRITAPGLPLPLLARGRHMYLILRIVGFGFCFLRCLQSETGPPPCAFPKGKKDLGKYQGQDCEWSNKSTWWTRCSFPLMKEGPL